MYKHNFKSRQELKEKNFSYSHFFDGYTLRFPVWKWKDKTVLECLATIFIEENWINPRIKLDVVSVNTYDYYSPFYIDSPVHRDFIRQIDANIDKKLESIGIVKQEKKPLRLLKRKKGG